MASTRRAWLAAVAASASLAGCVGDDDGGGGTDDEGGTDDGATNENGDGSTDGGNETAATVAVAEHGEYGQLLVDGDGMTLYMFDSDEQGAGASTCTDGCAANWPPLTVEGDAMAGDDVDAELTTFERADGSTQVAANGWPLYYWQGDSEPGDATGQGVNDVWWVLDPSGEPIRPGSESSNGSGGDGNDGSTGY
ncbi:COG4315 family predicted lipoprotein [Salinarchaeum chitinilyticum]